MRHIWGLGWDYGADVAKSGNGEGYGLKEEVYEVLVLPVHEIVAAAEEEEDGEPQLMWQDPMMLPGCANGVESGDDAWNVNGSPLWDFDFRHQNGQGKNDAVEEERDHVSYDFPNEEEAVDHDRKTSDVAGNGRP
nr:hypothetical protein Iba_chr07cCG5280 [Ipomoea batatas]